LINRIDEIVIFEKLKQHDLEGIVKLLMKELCVRLKKKNVTMTVDGSVYLFITKQIDNTKFGARPIRRAIQQHIEDPICDKMIDMVYDTNKNYHVKLQADSSLDINLEILDPGQRGRSNIC